MKRLQAFLIIAFIKIIPLQAQDSLVCKGSASIVANGKLNVVYVGLQNPLFISYHNSKKFTFKCDKGKIIKRDDFYYLGNLLEPGICHISLANKKGRNIEYFDFRIKNLPAPIATIANQISNTEINKNLLAYGCVIPVIENFDYEVYYKILSYKVLITHTNGEYSSYSVTGSCLTPELKACILKLESGDRILFYSIKCKLDSPDNIPEQELSTIDLTIK